MKKVILLLIVLFSGAGSIDSLAQNLSIQKFAEVNADLYRGGRPSASDLSILKSKYNIKTIIDLEDQPSVMTIEQKNAEKIGIHWIKEEMSATVVPGDSELADINKILTDPSYFPVYVHCLHGEDRTGLVIGLYDVEVQKMNPAEAYQEMLSSGFHPKYTALDETFRNKTGYSGP